MTQLYIENQQVDLSADFSALLTFAIDDIKDFSAKNTSFSKTIILPGTARNNQIFGQLFDVKAASTYNEGLPNYGYNFNAAKSARALLFQDQIQQFKGIIRLLEIVIDNGSVEYEVAVFGELSGLVLKLGNNKLENLDFSAYNHVWNVTNIAATWPLYNHGEGYFYPLIDYGKQSILKDKWDLTAFRPALFVKEYIDKMFAAAGYTYDCALFNTTRFKSLIIPYNRKEFTTLSTQILRATRGLTPWIWLDGGTSSVERLEFSTVVNTTFTDSLANSRFTYTPATTTTLNITFNIQGTYEASIEEFTIEINLNGSVIGTNSFVITPTGNTSPVPFSFSGAFTQVFAQNDYIDITASVSSPTSPIPGYLQVEGAALEINSNVAIITPMDSGDMCEINQHIPQNYLQKDFFSSIVKLFNLYVYDDINKANHVKIEPYVDFYDITDTGQDFTYKLDHGKPVRIKPMSELNARIYEFKWTSDSDYYNDLYKKRYNENYGDRIFDSNFEFTNAKETIEVIFSPSPLTGYTGEDKIFPSIFKLTNGVEEEIDSNIRILQANYITGVTSWKIEKPDGSGTLRTGTTYGYAGHLDDPDAPNADLNFGAVKELFFTLATGNISNNQFNVYWSSYMAEITDKDSKLLTGYFKFNPSDIYNLSFARYVYLDGSLWRISKIEDFNPSQPDVCKVELLKVIYKEY